MKIKHIFLLFLTISLSGTALNLSAQTVTEQGNTAQAVTAQNAASVRQSLVNGAKKYVGAPYAFGGIGPESFDCSGFIFTVSRESTGVQLPRTVKALYSFVQVIPQTQLEAGDIVFFRTTGDGTISHAGIYIGNNQFMHAVSDGPNTGVIVSSLKEATWKKAYAGSGRFLPSAQYSENLAENASLAAASGTIAGAAAGSETVSASGETSGTAGTKNAASSASNASNASVANKTTGAKEKTGKETRSSVAKKNSKNTSSKHAPAFANKLVFDAFAGIDWALFTSSRFMLNFRGVPVMTNLRCKDWPLEPGIYTGFRFNTGVDAFQIPLAISITPNDYFRCYAGPVITFGKPELPGDDGNEIKASAFPGIIGVSWTTPSFTKGKVKVSLCQDISYSVFNKTDGSALSPKDSFAAGLVFSTGIRVTLPFNSFFK